MTVTSMSHICRFVCKDRDHGMVFPMCRLQFYKYAIMSEEQPTAEVVPSPVKVPPNRSDSTRVYEDFA